VLVLLCVRLYLFDLGGRNIPRKNSANADAFPVYFEHDLGRLFPAQGKETLQHSDHEVHGGIVVVQQHHLVQGWRFGLNRLYRQNCVFLLPVRHYRRINPLSPAKAGEIHPGTEFSAYFRRKREFFKGRNDRENPPNAAVSGGIDFRCQIP